MGKRQNRRKHHTQYHTMEPRGQPFPAGDHQAVRYDKDKHETQITKMIHKTSTALEQSVRKFLEGLNIFYGTNLTPISDVDQNTYGKVTHENSLVKG